MKVSSFFKLVEIQTKVASLFPFLLGILFTYDRYQAFVPELLGLFFVSMICIDMATTALNNFWDYKRAIKREGYNYEKHNAMVRDEIPDGVAMAAIFILICIAAGAGMILFLKTDWVVLVIGVLSFGVGILYSYGPIPVSRTPLGELVSGLVMGGFIFFITTYIQVFQEGMIIVYMRTSVLHIQLELREVLGIVGASIPLVILIANIMLANNICDMAEDMHNRRYTLPNFLGRDRSLKLHAVLYLLAYAVIVVCVILKVLPIANLLVLLSIFPVMQNVRIFSRHPDKASTFVTAVKNLVLFSGVWAASFVISVLFSKFL